MATFPKTAITGTIKMADFISVHMSMKEYVVLPTCVENFGILNSGRPGFTEPEKQKFLLRQRFHR